MIVVCWLLKPPERRCESPLRWAIVHSNCALYLRLNNYHQPQTQQLEQQMYNRTKITVYSIVFGWVFCWSPVNTSIVNQTHFTCELTTLHCDSVAHARNRWQRIHNTRNQALLHTLWYRMILSFSLCILCECFMWPSRNSLIIFTPSLNVSAASIPSGPDVIRCRVFQINLFQ